MMTVQAPQVARSQTFLAPVWSRMLRSASMSVTRGSRFRLYGLPLILRVTGTAPGPATFPAGAACAAVSRRPLPRAPVLIPTPRMKPRRENPFLGFLGASGSFLELTRHLPFASFEVGFYYEDFVVKRVNYIRNRKRRTNEKTGTQTQLR